MPDRSGLVIDARERRLERKPSSQAVLSRNRLTSAGRVRASPISIRHWVFIGLAVSPIPMWEINPEKRESKMSSINYIKAANDVAKLFVAQANGMLQLSDKLLQALREAESNGTDVNLVWASIARTNGWSDRDAGLEGNPMPKTLANYRSMSRKAIDLAVGHNYSDHAAWKKAIAQAVKLSKVEPESAPIEAIDLNEIELPSYVEHIIKKRAGMTEKNIKTFDSVIIRAIEKFMEVA